MSQQTKTRRRLETEASNETRIGRGCLIWGGVLGIVVGLAFAFYGLKPILKHFYGEKTVAVMGTYTGNGKQIQVEGVSRSDTFTDDRCLPDERDPETVYCLALNVTSDKAWTGLDATQFSLQAPGQHDWIMATSISGPYGGQPYIAAGTPITISVHFPLSPGQDFNPEYLHLTSPRVRFALK